MNISKWYASTFERRVRLVGEKWNIIELIQRQRASAFSATEQTKMRKRSTPATVIFSAYAKPSFTAKQRKLRKWIYQVIKKFEKNEISGGCQERWKLWEANDKELDILSHYYVLTRWNLYTFRLESKAKTTISIFLLNDLFFVFPITNFSKLFRFSKQCYETNRTITSKFYVCRRSFTLSPDIFS